MATDTRLWHPFAAMGTVRSSELVITRGKGRLGLGRRGAALPGCDRRASGTRTSATVVPRSRPRSPDSSSSIETYSAFGDLANEPALGAAAASRRARAGALRSHLLRSGGGADAVDTAAQARAALLGRSWAAPTASHVHQPLWRIPRHSRLRHQHCRHRARTASASVTFDRRRSRSSIATRLDELAREDRARRARPNRRVHLRAGDRSGWGVPASRRLPGGVAEALCREAGIPAGRGLRRSVASDGSGRGSESSAGASRPT